MNSTPAEACRPQAENPKPRIPLAEAQQLANEVVDLFRGVCERIEIGGSIRRKKETVGDTEIVIEPRLTPAYDMFGDICGMVNEQYEYSKLCREKGVLQPRLDINGTGAWGERYQRAIYKGFALDIFCVLPPAQWGVIMAIRTGPATFSKRVVTSRLFGGRLPTGYQIKDGQLLIGGQPVLVETEKEFFNLIELEYVPPEERF